MKLSFLKVFMSCCKLFSCRCVGKKWLFWFCEGSACVSGKTKCAICAVAKIELKKSAVGKIKNTEGSAMSVGLLVVRLQYGLYVGHLSKWFVFVNSFNF
jgi:hypothetical protein